MDPSTIPDQNKNKDSVAASAAQDSLRQEHVQQVKVDNIVQQKRRQANRREAARRQANDAFRESVERNQALDRQNMQAGVEKMVRSVVRKESSRTEQHHVRNSAVESHEQAEYVREKLNSAYSTTVSESPHDETFRSSPSQRQQQRAIDDYQQSNRNSLDHVVELVI